MELKETQKNTVVKKVQQFLKEFAKPDLDGYAFLELPHFTWLVNNYLVVLKWEDGYDGEDHEENPFITEDGWGLNVVILTDCGYMFKDENPYVISSKYGDIVDGYTITPDYVKDGFKGISESIANDFELVCRVDDMQYQDLTEEQRAEMFDLLDNLNFKKGDRVLINTDLIYDDDVFELIDDKGTDEFTVDYVSYLDKMVYIQEADIGIDMNACIKGVDKIVC